MPMAVIIPSRGSIVINGFGQQRIWNIQHHGRSDGTRKGILSIVKRGRIEFPLAGCGFESAQTHLVAEKRVFDGASPDTEAIGEIGDHPGFGFADLRPTLTQCHDCLVDNANSQIAASELEREGFSRSHLLVRARMEVIQGAAVEIIHRSGLRFWIGYQNDGGGVRDIRRENINVRQVQLRHLPRQFSIEVVSHNLNDACLTVRLKIDGTFLTLAGQQQFESVGTPEIPFVRVDLQASVHALKLFRIGDFLSSGFQRWAAHDGQGDKIGRAGSPLPAERVD
jgi:hypothetical protein